MITTPSHDINLLKLLIEITQSLKTVNVKDRFDFDEILYEYKNAIFEVKSEGTEVKSEEAFRKFAHSLALGEKLDEKRLDLFLNNNKYLVEKGDWVKIIAKWKKENVPNIVSSDLKSEALHQFYKDHACCWVNYIGCDSFSDKVKRQVFFSSVLMEDEDEILNKKLLTINDRIFKTYNSMLDERIPADLWVQLFFLNQEKIVEMCKSQRIAATKQTQLLNTFSNIQNYGLVIPLGHDSLIDSDDSRIRPLLINKQRIEPVTIDSVNQLLIDKDRANFSEEVIKILDAISIGKEPSSYLTEQIGRLNKSLHHKVEYLYYLPAEGANGAVGLIIYGSKRRLRNEEIDDIKLLGYNILFPYVSAYKSAWENQMVVKESIKSAISAIMSRNMSHNLGSHYLYYTKNHLERLANELSNEQSPDIRGAARVLGYTQARMDYLATIISNDKYPYGSVNFKSQIFDELTIDDFSKRHFIGASKKNNRTVNYLLSNLIRSEDFTRPSIMTDGGQNPDNLDLLKLQIKYTEDGYNYNCFTGTNFELDDDDDPEDFEGIPTITSERDLKHTLSSIDLALPGGNMSCHAFFNVVENFIRNSAKYLREDFYREEGHSEKSLTTNVVLRYTSSTHKFIEFVIYDNKQNATFYKLVKRTLELDKRIQEKDSSITSFFRNCIEDYKSKSEYTSSLPLCSTCNYCDVEYIRSVSATILKQIKESSIEGKDQLFRDAKSIVRAWQKDCLFEQIRGRLGSIRVLDDSNALDKENKGLKEMMFSAAWMRSYCFPAGKTYTDIIFDVQNEKDSEEKLNLIKKYCFSPVMVLEQKESLLILSEIDLKNVYYKPACFGISFVLPVFKKTDTLSIVQDEPSMIQNCLDMYSDIIIFDTSLCCPLNLKAVFTRIYPLHLSRDKSETQIFREILQQRFPGFNDFWLSFGAKEEKTGIHDDAHHIKFDHHMKEHIIAKGGLESQLKYAYSDSVSGGNFTKTMNELFDSSITGGLYHSESEEYFALKIKESALTRITIIDERLCDSMEKSESQLELSLKNIRLLNYRDTDVISSFTDLFKGNTFKDNQDTTHFLSIHLGLIEKIVQSTEFSNFIGELSPVNKARKFMSLLRDSFGGDNVFISIHSGRGNFSAELEGPLAGYPFITMSSLESAFNNSKYLLSQLFYNTLYIGKGKINNHSK